MELKIQNVTKRYRDKTAVDDVSITLTPGVWGLLGANGAGKTTLMRMLAGILRPSSGRILCDGVEVGTLGAAYREKLGYLPQEFGFYPEFTVQDYLEYMAALKGLPRTEAARQIDALLERVSLTEVRRKKIVKLSGGMKRRVGIAQALLNDPEILILDEPTAGLDVQARNDVLDILREYMAEDENRSIIITSHISSDIENLCDDVYLINDGRIILHEDTDTIVEQYGIVKVKEEQYEKLDKNYILKTKKECYGYACFVSSKAFYKENYPDITVENGGIDELILMMAGGDR